MTLASALERLRAAVVPGADARRGVGGDHVRVRTADLAQLLDDYERIDARMRVAHFHQNRRAYPPRADMLARAASDPGAFAGSKGDRTMGRWISDAILAIESTFAPEEVRELDRRLRDVAAQLIKTRPQFGYTIREGAAELIDQSYRIERLRRVLARYGDRVPMAMCHRADWQHEIDEALEWVANNADHDLQGG